MKIFTYGKTENPKILLLHPMFTDECFFEEFIAAMHDKFFIIVPVLSGHYNNSTFVSIEEEEKQIDKFLLENNIRELRAIIGFSLGGNIAYDYFCKHTGKFKRAIIDSAPMFNFSKLTKRRYLRKYSQCLKRVKSGLCDVSAELDKCFNGMGKYQKAVAPQISEESLAGLVDSCFSVKLYGLEKEEQKRITFVYGMHDIARFCLHRLKRYKFTNVIKLKDYSHCGYFKGDMKNYIEDFIV